MCDTRKKVEVFKCVKEKGLIMDAVRRLYDEILVLTLLYGCGALMWYEYDEPKNGLVEMCLWFKKD